MWGYDVQYNGTKGGEIGILVVQRPDIPAPEKRYSTYEIPDRDGTLYVNDNTIADIEIEVEFNFMGEPEEWFSLFRTAKGWLMNRSEGKLVFLDDPDYFYKVKRVQIETAERICYEIGRFIARFVCAGCQYLEAGTQEYTPQQAAENPYYLSHPVYKITGEGMCTLTVNGKTMTANVGQNITIDTERKVSYRQDGTVQNTEVTGWYEDLYLMSGTNTISVTSGFDLSVIPNWRSL